MNVALQILWRLAYNSERIFKIGQYLTKLCVEHLGFTFFGPPCTYYQVHQSVVWFVEAIIRFALAMCTAQISQLLRYTVTGSYYRGLWSGRHYNTCQPPHIHIQHVRQWLAEFPTRSGALYLYMVLPVPLSREVLPVGQLVACKVVSAKCGWLMAGPMQSRRGLWLACFSLTSAAVRHGMRHHTFWER